MSVIIVDSREQRALWPTGKTVVKMKLDVGDYTTGRLLNKKHAERKSPQDLYQTITSQHERFRKEIIRSWTKGITLQVFVECTQEIFLTKKWDKTRKLKIPTNTLSKIISTLENKYCLKITWCKNRQHMKKEILTWLEYNKSNETTEQQSTQ